MLNEAEPKKSLWTTDIFPREPRTYHWRKDSNLKKKVSDTFHIPSHLNLTTNPGTEYCYLNFIGLKLRLRMARYFCEKLTALKW